MDNTLISRLSTIVPDRRARMALVGFGIAALLLLGFALAPVTREVLRITAPHTNLDTEHFGGARSVGQAFVGPRNRISEIRVNFALPVPPDAFPILFHLKHGRYTGDDVRTVVLSPDDLKSDGTLRIRFLPVEQSAGRTYVFALEAPHARRGLSLYRQIDGSIYDSGYLYRADTNEDRPGDLEFALFARTPRIAVVWERVFPGLATSADAQLALQRALVFGIALMGVLLLLLPRAERLSRRHVLWILSALVVVHLLLHLPFVFFYPGVNDEGSYLMDVQGLRNGYIPFRDTLAKGPLLLVLLTPIGLWFPHTLFPARLFVASASALELVLLYHLGRALGGLPAGAAPARSDAAASGEPQALQAGRGAGLLAAVLWALSPAAIAQTSQLFLQALSLPLVTFALLVLVRDGRRAHLVRAVPPPLLAGIVLGGAYLIRASSLAFLVPAFFVALLPLRPARQSLRRAGLLLLGFAAILGGTALLSLPFLGFEATAVMLNLEAFVIGTTRAGVGSAAGISFLPPWEILERFAAFGTTLFRTGMGLMLVWAAFIAVSLMRILKLPRAVGGALFLGILLPLLARILPLNFGLSGSVASFGSALRLLASVLLIFLAYLIGWSSTKRPATPTEASPPSPSPFAKAPGDKRLRGAPASPVETGEGGWKRGHAQDSATRLMPAFLITGLTWLALALVYSFFGRFRQQYHAEFLPLYVLGSALLLAPLLSGPVGQPAAASPQTMLAGLRPRRAAAAATLAIVGTLSVLGYTIARAQPHVGSIPHRTAREVGRILRRHSAPGEEILTAQGLFAYYADRQIVFGAAHPGWYLEERVGTVPTELRRRFLPDKDRVRDAVRERVRLVAIDRRTREVYFLYDPEMREILEREFELLATVNNPYEENPVEIWIRRS